MDGLRIYVCVDDWVIPFTIRKDNTVRRERFYTVIKNPYVDYYESKVIWGSTGDILRNKVVKQIEKWRDSKHEQRKHEIQEQSTGEEDSLPFY